MKEHSRCSRLLKHYAKKNVDYSGLYKMKKMQQELKILQLKRGFFVAQI
jgi:hypothetical protein